MKLAEYVSKYRHWKKTIDVPSIIKLSESGKTDEEIASELGYHKHTVYKYRRINGVKYQTGRRSKIDYDRALELYKSGKNDKEIASVLECCSKTIAGWRVKNGLPPAWINITNCNEEGRMVDGWVEL